MRKHVYTLYLSMCCFLPHEALAEVMDKEPSIFKILVIGLVGIAPALLLSTRYLYVALALSIASLCWFVAFFKELYFSAVGSAMFHEASGLYLTLCHLLPLYTLILCYRNLLRLRKIHIADSAL